MLFEKNIGPKLSIDEVALTNGELYTVITNKAKHGQKGVLVAMLEGTKAANIAPVLAQIPLEKRLVATEVTLDMSESMEAIIKRTFPRARIVTDRFHVQQLVSSAVQEVRIALRWEAIKEENEQIRAAREAGQNYRPVIYKNGDTKKQLLARSRYLLFSPQSKWHSQQTERAAVLFYEFPKLKEAYDLSMMFRSCYEHSRTITEAKEKLNKWYEKVAEKNFDSFMTAAHSIRLRETTILNYFINRSTNASAESFNAKLKNFRTVVRGVRDRTFHLFRVAKLYG
ncbi:MAG TPA: transposase [Candidatus Peribacteraceae bacterium]|nr:transposase [Candidatus Peribacteraceae bacterium]